MRSFDNPSPGFEPRVALYLFDFLAARFDMRLIVPTLKKVANFSRVIAFVEADMLMTFRCWLRAFYRSAVKSLFNKLNIVDVGTSDFNTQWNTASIRENGSLGS